MQVNLIRNYIVFSRRLEGTTIAIIFISMFTKIQALFKHVYNRKEVVVERERSSSELVRLHRLIPLTFNVSPVCNVLLYERHFPFLNILKRIKGKVV